MTGVYGISIKIHRNNENMVYMGKSDQVLTFISIPIRNYSKQLVIEIQYALLFDYIDFYH